MFPLWLACRSAGGIITDESDDSDDTVGDSDDTAATADHDGDGWTADVDCQDYNDDIHPGAVEPLCGTIDLNCDGDPLSGPFILDGGTSFPSLQAALDATTGAADIAVCPGTWRTN